MRRYNANDRIVPNELTAANVDAPERATYVVTDTKPTAPTDLEVGCEAGTVVIDGDEVGVSAQTESVSDITGEVSETAYRYHTLSVDATGELVVRSSDIGEFDANDPDAEPITQVAEPSHETGEVFLGTAFQVEGAIERVFDGRYVLVDVPNSVITQGEGSGLDADTVRGAIAWTPDNDGAGSGLDADLVRGEDPVETVRGQRGDVTAIDATIDGPEFSFFYDDGAGTRDVNDIYCDGQITVTWDASLEDDDETTTVTIKIRGRSDITIGPQNIGANETITETANFEDISLVTEVDVGNFPGTLDVESFDTTVEFQGVNLTR